MLKNILYFLAGAAVGGTVAAMVTKKILDAEKDKEITRAVDGFRDAYASRKEIDEDYVSRHPSNRESITPEGVVSRYAKNIKINEVNGEEEELTSFYEQSSLVQSDPASEKRTDYRGEGPKEIDVGDDLEDINDYVNDKGGDNDEDNDQDISNDTTEDERDDEDSKNMSEERQEFIRKAKQDGLNPIPYVITKTEFMDTKPGYDKICADYYVDDPAEIVCEAETKEIIDEVDKYVGKANLKRFGEASENKDIVYVRNDYFGIDYEILRVPKENYISTPQANAMKFTKKDLQDNKLVQKILNKKRFEGDVDESEEDN